MRAQLVKCLGSLFGSMHEVCKHMGVKRYLKNLKRKKRKLKNRNFIRPPRRSAIEYNKAFVENIYLTRNSYPSPGTRTSKSHVVDKCYANQFENCEGGISREHYISESILEQLDTIPSSGVPWLNARVETISPSSLTTKCLCEGHNSDLSYLDSFAGDLFRHMKNFNDKNQRIFLSGNLLELWMIKALAGLLCTGQFQHEGKIFNASDIPSEWLEYLYCNESLPAEYGLYVRYSKGTRINVKPRIAIAPVFLGKGVSGLILNFVGFEFLLSMRPKAKNFNIESSQYPNLIHRLNRINHDSGPGGMEFIWDKS